MSHEGAPCPTHYRASSVFQTTVIAASIVIINQWCAGSSSKYVKSQCLHIIMPWHRSPKCEQFFATDQNTWYSNAWISMGVNPLEWRIAVIRNLHFRYTSHSLSSLSPSFSQRSALAQHCAVFWLRFPTSFLHRCAGVPMGVIPNNFLTNTYHFLELCWCEKG